METKVGGDKLKEATVPGRGKKRPPSPASSPSDDDGEDSSMSTSDDDGWESESDDEDYRDTATSEAKKSKSPTLRMMKDHVADMVKKQAAKNEYLKQEFIEKQQRKATLGDRIRQVQQLARECGVSETGPEWYALYKICKDENSMESFIGMPTTEERMAFLNTYDGNSARDGDTSGEFRLLVEQDDRDGDTPGESSEDELFRFLVEEGDDRDILDCLRMLAIQYDTFYNKAKRRRPIDDEDYRDTARSEAKKSKRLALRMMNDYMADMAKIQAARTEYFKQAFSIMQACSKKAARDEKIRQVVQLARECGVSGPDWVALCKICKDGNSMEFFIGMSTTEGRMAFFKRYVRLNNLI